MVFFGRCSGGLVESQLVTWIHKLQNFTSSKHCMYTIPAATNAIILVLFGKWERAASWKIQENTVSLILARRPKYIQIDSNN